MIDKKTVFKYRYYVLSSIKTEFLSRINRSKFAFFWMVAHPLAQTAVFAFILSSVMSAKLDGISSNGAYAIYLLSGMCFWSLFGEIATRTSAVFVENGHLIKKTAIPKLTFVLSAIGLAVVNNLILICCILTIFFFLGHWVGANGFWLFVFLPAVIFLSAGIGIVFGVLSVFVRDIGNMFSLGMQFLFWLTPVVYVPKLIPQNYSWVLEVNPAYYLISGYHDALAFCKVPNISDIVFSYFFAALFFFFGLYLLKKLEPAMADVL